MAASTSEKRSGGDKKLENTVAVTTVLEAVSPRASTPPLIHDHTHRKLQGRHIQLIGIGGTIGTILFVQIGSGLAKGGPGCLFIAFTFWSTFVLALNNCLSEMVTWIPISSPFIRYAEHFVDPALGFCNGINFFIIQAVGVPFEITAFNLMLRNWTDKIPVVAVIIFMLVCYTLLNVFAVKYYGESEFWLAIGKVILIIGLILFTFITMVGGNPLHDAYGFRNWNPSNVPGAPFAEYIKTGSPGHLMGFLACLIQAAITVGGPDSVAMTAGEAANPRITLPRAFNTVMYRLLTFFILGSLCVGLVVPYNDPILVSTLASSHSSHVRHKSSGISPYIIAMHRLHIPILPHIVNALIMMSIFSAGNSFVYIASRTLYGLALEGKVPRFLAWCTKGGVPLWCVAVVMTTANLAFLGVSNDGVVILQWLISLLTAAQLLSCAITSLAYIRFYKALQIQGFSRDSLPYRSWWQPFCGYYAFIGNIIMAFVSGYTVFIPGHWDLRSFCFSYGMIFFIPALYIFWKVLRRTKWYRLDEIKFFEAEREEIDAYEATYIQPPRPMGIIRKFGHWILG